MEELKAKKIDLSIRVIREEERGLQRLPKIQVWFTSVETIQKEVEVLLTGRNVQLQRLSLWVFLQEFTIKLSLREKCFLDVEDG